MENEIWRIIPSFPDYEASNLGRIRRRTPRQQNYRTATGPVMKLHMQGNYLAVTLMRPNSKRYTPRRVNRLVCEAFHGVPPTNAHYCAHGDGNPINNGEHNLRWVMPVENRMDAILHGTASIGSRSTKAKLKESDIQAIREARTKGETWKSISDRLDVSVRTVRNAHAGKSWKHVSKTV